MIAKPLLTIDKFSGMNNNGGVFYVDGFTPRNENGVSMMSEDFACGEKFTSATTGFANIGSIKSIEYMYSLVGGNTYSLLLDDAGKVWRYASAGGQGEMGGSGNDGAYKPCTLPDIQQLTNGNLVYTSAYHLSSIIRGKVKTGSSTTKIIDTDGRNFVTLGLTTSSPNNIVTNTITGAKYTITTISTTTATNDTLEFTAITGKDNTANDEFLAFVGTKYLMNYSDGTSGSTNLGTHFIGQPDATIWSRPIVQWGDIFLIGNGNYLSSLTADASTIDNSYKQLPVGFQLLDVSVNNTYILVSAMSNTGQPHLLLWDGFSDGWNNIMPIEDATYSLAAYENGWVYVILNTLFYTDGQNKTRMSEYCDATSTNRYSIAPTSPNNIAVYNDKIYIASSSTGNYRRILPGVYVFDKDFGWTFVPVSYSGRLFGIPTSLFVKREPGSNFSFRTGIEYGAGSTYGFITGEAVNTVGYDTRSFMYYLDFKQPQQVKEIQLVLQASTKYSDEPQASTSSDVTINIGDGNDDIYKHLQAYSVSKTAVDGDTIANTYGATWPGTLNAEIQLLDGGYGGERTYITAIANPGTANEVWTVSPALSKNYAGGGSLLNIRQINVRKCETKTVNRNQLNEPVRFQTPGFISDKCFIEVVVRGKTNSFNVSVVDINLF